MLKYGKGSNKFFEDFENCADLDGFDTFDTFKINYCSTCSNNNANKICSLCNNHLCSNCRIDCKGCPKIYCSACVEKSDLTGIVCDCDDAFINNKDIKCNECGSKEYIENDDNIICIIDFINCNKCNKIVCTDCSKIITKCFICNKDIDPVSLCLACFNDKMFDLKYYNYYNCYNCTNRLSEKKIL